MAWLLRNWHLKLSSVLLATVLYTGLVFSGSFSEAVLQVPVEQQNPTSDTYVLSGDLGFVEVRYRTTNDLSTAVSADAFRAYVDLTDYDLDRSPEPQQLPVEVTTDTEGVQILSWEPRRVRVEMDRIEVRTVPVEVDTGEVPEGLEIGDPEVSVEQAQVRGPASIVRQVDRAVAFIAIDASGIDFNEPVTLQPVDARGQPISGVPIELDPETVSVQVDVSTVETNRTVPVRPVIEPGSPAPGFALEALGVEPSLVTLRGLPEVLAEVSEVLTEPLSISGAREDQTFEAELVLPEGVRLVDRADPTVTVTATIRPSVSSRTFVLGVVCQGAGENACLPGLEQVSVALTGPGELLAGLSAADLTPIVDVGGLNPGTYTLQPAIAGLPEGVELLGISPASIPVSVVAPSTPAPEPTATP